MMHPIQARVERADWWRSHLRNRCRTGLARLPQRRVVLISQVVVAVCEYFGLTPEQLGRKGREGEVVRARQIGFFVARKMTERSFNEIGQQFGGFDHSTVFHGVRQIERLMRENPEVHTDVDTIISSVLNGW